MTDANLTHLYFLLDRSGSMVSLREDTIGGFDTFIAEQRTAPGRCRVTLAQFDNEYDEVYADRDIATVPSLVLVPRGSTALLDALGRLVVTAGERLAALPEQDTAGQRHRRGDDRRLRERLPGLDARPDQGADRAAVDTSTAGSSSTSAPTRTRSRRARRWASPPASR